MSTVPACAVMLRVNSVGAFVLPERTLAKGAAFISDAPAPSEASRL